MEGDMVRRKVHDMVQELKDNIRVLCRVQLVFPSDIVSLTLARKSSIILHSSGESAERKEVCSFGFFCEFIRISFRSALALRI
jgi:kinesin family member C1